MIHLDPLATRLRRVAAGLLLLFTAFASVARAVPNSAVRPLMAAPTATETRAAPLVQPLLAEGSMEDVVEKFLGFIKSILTIIAVLMVLWSGLLFHDGKIREGLYALTGAFVLMMARIIVDYLKNLGS